MLARRNFLAGLGALIAAPAVVKVASLMPLRSTQLLTPNWLPFDLSSVVEHTALAPKTAWVSGTAVRLQQREAELALADLFRSTNKFIREAEARYLQEFEFRAAPQWPDQLKGMKIGTTLRIRLPSDYVPS